MTHEQMIEVIQAHKDGKVIEVREYGRKAAAWVALKQPCWNFDEYEYRIKPEAMYRPWKTEDEVPVGSVVRGEGMKRVITAATMNDVFTGGVAVQMGSMWASSVDIFKNYTMLDGSPCGVLDDAQKD